MRYYPLMFAAAILFLILSVPVHADDGIQWTMSVSPSVVINNGDNISFDVAGWGSSYITIDILNQGTNATIDTFSFVTGSDGRGSYNWSVPIQQPSGTYEAILRDGTDNLTAVTFSIVYDRQSYDEYLLGQQGTKIEQQSGQIVIMGNYIIDVQGRLVFIYAAALILLVICLYVSYSWVHHMRPWKEWKLNQDKFHRSNLRGATRLFYKMTSPPPDGLQTLVMPGLESKMKKELARSKNGNGPPIIESFVVLTDPGSPNGVRIFPLKDMPGMEGKKDVVPKYEDSEEEAKDVMKASEEEIEEAEIRFPRISLKEKLSNLIHFRRNRKKASYRPLKYPMGPVDEDDDVDDVKPIPAIERRERRMVRVRPNAKPVEEAVEEEATELEPKPEEDIPQLTMEQMRAQAKKEVLKEMLAQAMAMLPKESEPERMVEPIPEPEPEMVVPKTTRKKRSGMTRSTIASKMVNKGVGK